MIIAVLGFLDLVAGGILLLDGLGGSGYLLGFGILFLLKALYSIGTAMAGGFYFDVLGWLDLAGAIALLLLYWGIYSGIFFWIGILLILKAIYSFLVAFMQH